MEIFGHLPVIDHDRFWDAYTIRYGVSEEDATPEGQRELYFTEAVADAFKIIDLRSKTRLKDREQKDLEWLLNGFGAYLTETELFFGTQNAEALRQILRIHTGFEFNDDYELIEEKMARAKVKTTGESIDVSKMSDEEFKKTLDHVVPEDKNSTFRLHWELFVVDGEIQQATDPSAIISGRPVKAITFAGAKYVLSGCVNSPKNGWTEEARAWRIVPRDEFQGKLAAEPNSVTGYHGVKVLVGDDDNGQDFVMLGPSVTFVPDVAEKPVGQPAKVYISTLKKKSYVLWENGVYQIKSVPTKTNMHWFLAWPGSDSGPVTSDDILVTPVEKSEALRLYAEQQKARRGGAASDSQISDLKSEIAPEANETQGIPYSIPSEEARAQAWNQRNIVPRDVRSIPLEDLVLSDFEPQVRRRSRFTDDEIDELAYDISQNTLLHPIVARPFADKFQIVVGERRFLAVKHLGLSAIDATVKTLSDEEAFNLQYSENSKRKDVHPIDEAYNFKCLQDRFGYDLDEISVHAGQKPAYVASRLKLLDLAPVVQQAFENDEILFGHALEIGRYRREDHGELLEYVFVESRDKKGTIPVPKLRERIDQFYLRRLKSAPFSIKSEDLREDKLKCTECPERTGAKQTLFEDFAEEDRCLDPSCWNAKVSTFVQIQRIKTALGGFDAKAQISKSDAKKVKEVLMVADGWVDRSNAPSEPYAEKYQLREIKRGECESEKIGVFFNGDRVGKQIHYCGDKEKCKVHSRGSSSSTKTEDPNERLRRKEELFDMNVSDLVRRQVFAAASKKFATFDESGLVLPMEFLSRLVAKLWLNSTSGDAGKSRSVIKDVFAEVTGINFEVEHHDLDSAAGALEQEYTEIELNIALFLLVHSEQGACYWERFKSQAGVKDLAEQYEIDYRMIDAEQRLAFAEEKHKKHVDLFKVYLGNVQAGNEVPIPRPYLPTYQAPE